jgi:hypothetical protein
MKPGRQRVRGLAPSPVFARKLGWLTVLTMCVLGAASWWSTTFPALTIRQLPDDRVLYQIPMRTDGRFALAYIHSIHRRPVEDHFHINDRRQIVLDSTVFDSYGVGIPTSVEGGETLRLADGKMKLENMNRVLGRFDLRIGQVIANHQLIVRGRTIPLAHLGKPGSAVRLEVDRLNLWLYLKGVVRHG